MSEGKKPVSWKRRLLRTAALTAATYLVLGAAFIMFLEHRFIYFPTKGAVGPSPGEEVTLTCADGVTIHGWWVPKEGAKVTILLFHGNAGNLEDRRGLIRALNGLPANVMAIDYRGYGKSGGEPSEEGLYHDARAAWDWLVAKVPADRIIIHGKSLGGGPACELASRVACGGLIVESAFTSAPDMAGRVMPLFPARFFVRTRFDNLSKVGGIGCPKLFIHSRKDEVIPFEMSERLFERAAEPKARLWIDQAGHNDLRDHHGKAYLEALRSLAEQVAAGRPRS